MATKTYTAGEIAEYIRWPDEPPATAVARFKNWAKEGLIEPIGEKNPGTGRRKKYSTISLFEAVLLQALTDALGAPAVSLRDPIRRIVRHDLLRLSHLIVLSGRGPNATIKAVTLSKLKSYISRSSSAVHTIINLRDIFERLPYDQYLREILAGGSQRLEDIQAEARKSGFKDGWFEAYRANTDQLRRQLSGVEKATTEFLVDKSRRKRKS